MRAELRMLSSWLHGKSKGLIVPHGRVEVGYPVHQMVEPHHPILHSRPTNGQRRLRVPALRAQARWDRAIEARRSPFRSRRGHWRPASPQPVTRYRSADRNRQNCITLSDGGVRGELAPSRRSGAGFARLVWLTQSSYSGNLRVDMLGHARLGTVRLYTRSGAVGRERALNLLS